MAENDSVNSCCLGITVIITIGILTCLAPGLLLTIPLAGIFDLNDSQIWGSTIGLSTVVFFLFKFCTQDGFINYGKASILCSIIIVVLLLVSNKESSVNRTMEKIIPSDKEKTSPETINPMNQRDTYKIERDDRPRLQTDQAESENDITNHENDEIEQASTVEEENNTEESKSDNVEQEVSTESNDNTEGTSVETVEENM